MSFSNNYKKWYDDDKIILDNYIKNHNNIDNFAIKYLSNTLKRTEMAIIYRIFNNYIFNEFDFTYNNNENIYDKYSFYNEDKIDNFLIRNFTKKQKIKFKLNKINCVILNLIVDDSENKNIIKYNKIIDTIKEINNLNR